MTTTALGSTTLLLPTPDGGLVEHTLGERSPAFDATYDGPPRTRSVFAAGHVVADPLADPADLGTERALDWDATLAFRHHLWGLGLGVAEAMDTAQRGGGLDWALAKQLIRRSGTEAASVGGRIACGALTDQLEAGRTWPVQTLVEAYLEQVAWIADSGATPVLMASRHLAASASGPDDYLAVYDAVLDQVDGPVFLHWLGEAFDPLLRGYWGSADLDAASEVFLDLCRRHAGTVTGVKISLLDEQREVDLRRRLPAEVLMHTGDDFNYVPLIAGDGAEGTDHSHALLGVFDAVAAPARAALARLDAGDVDGFAALLEPTVPLARHLFAAPTSAYKTGVVFLAWLNGHQDHFRMLGGAEVQRSVGHLAQVLVLADLGGALADPELAAHRARTFLRVAGVDA
ncbi:MAG: dihydrodipicolinate synthase family protein [Nocardioides sp.]|nr:dihydrodipicolinate synthase family protein [Nocardioides sp.]